MTELRQNLMAEVRHGGYAYVRNLAMAESAVLEGQFNVAKVLRAAAHTQRILAMEAARLLTGGQLPAELFHTILLDLKHETGSDLFEAADLPAQSIVEAKLERFAVIKEQLEDIVQRAMASVAANNDVLESDVAQFQWGCYGCGYLIEGERPDSCPICGALSIEFVWFGPFYAAPPEHIGQLTPAEIRAILANIPDQVADIISNIEDDLLARKPSPDEWSVKEIVGHIIETDLLFSRRLNFILEGQGIPAIPRSTPPWKLHEDKGYQALSAAQLVERLRQARSESLGLIETLEPDQWVRQGTLLGTATSVLDLGSWLTNHDRGHLAQIRRMCSELNS